MTFDIKLQRILGAVLGLVAPIIALWIFYYVNFKTLPFEVFIRRMLFSNLFAPLLSLCILVNLLIFFSFIWLNRDEGARGVLFITFVYGLVMIILKII